MLAVIIEQKHLKYDFPPNLKIHSYIDISSIIMVFDSLILLKAFILRKLLKKNYIKNINYSPIEQNDR